MNKFLRLLLIIICVYLLVTSIYGLYVFFDNFLQVDFIGKIKNLFLTLPIYLYAFIVSISFFINLNNYKILNKRLIYVFIIFYIQIFHFRFSSLGLYILFGANLDLGYCSFCPDTFYFDASLFENAVLLINDVAKPGFIFTINFIPILFILILRIVQKRIITT